MAQPQNANTGAGISLASIVALLTAIAVFGTPLYLLGGIELQRLYELAYHLDRDTAWEAASLTPNPIVTREGIGVAIPAILIALLIAVVVLALTIAAWKLFTRFGAQWAGRRQTIRELREIPNSEVQTRFYVVTSIVAAVLCVAAYVVVFQVRGLHDAPSWAQETGAPWWSEYAAGLVAGAGAYFPLHGWVRKIPAGRWLILAGALTYAPALFTAYWDRVRPGQPALSTLPLSEVVLCLKHPRATIPLANSDVTTGASKIDAIWGDLLSDSGGYWHVFPNEFYGTVAKPTVARHYAPPVDVPLYSWNLYPSDELAYVPDYDVEYVIAPNGLPPQPTARPPDVCRAPLPYEILGTSGNRRPQRSQ